MRTDGLQEQCEEFNARFPVGTKVKYWEVLGHPEFKIYITRSQAFILNGHTACIFLEGKAGCVALNHCRPECMCPEN